MKLTEAKLKNLIKEMIGTTPLPHLDKITDLLASSMEEARTAASFIDSLEEYKTPENVNVDDELEFMKFVTIYFKDPAQAKQLYDALLPKIKPRKSVHVNYGNLYSYVMISYPQM